MKTQARIRLLETRLQARGGSSVSDVHRNTSKSCEGTDYRNRAVSDVRALLITE